MANMSYCKFENTANDFRDCLIALDEHGLDTIQSSSELDNAKRLVKLAKRLVEDHGEDIDNMTYSDLYDNEED